MKKTANCLVFLLFLPFSSHTLYSSFKISPKESQNETPSKIRLQANSNITQSFISLDIYNFNGPEFSERLNALRAEITILQLAKMEQKRLKKAQEKIQKQNKLRQKEKAASYKNTTMILGCSAVGSGIGSLHNNAKHWHASYK